LDPSAVHSQAIGAIGGRSIGPLLARNESGGLAAWIVSAERGPAQDLVVASLGVDGALIGRPRVVLSLQQEATLLIVRAAGRSSDGWLVAYATLLDRGEALTVVGLTPEGVLRAPPVDVQRTGDHVRWIDMVPTPKGVVCLWAEETVGGDANMLAEPLSAEGKPRGVAVRVAQRVTSWAAVAADDGVALAVVDGQAPGTTAPAGTLSWVRLDTEGRVRDARIPVVATPSVGPDFEVVPVIERDDSGVPECRSWVVAWTDRTGDDPQVTLAVVNRDDTVRGPFHAFDVVGGSRLVGLASGPAGVALAWDGPNGLTQATRVIHLDRVIPDDLPHVSSAPPLEVAARARVEFVGTGDGFALLTQSISCALATSDHLSAEGVGPSSVHAAPQSVAPCRGTAAPTWMRLDSNLVTVQVEPIVLGRDHQSATLAWQLECAAQRCSALAATVGTPTPVFSVDLMPADQRYRVPLAAEWPAGAARAMRITTLAAGESFVEVAAAHVGEETLIATLTDGTGETRRRGARTTSGAVVGLRRLAGDGTLASAPMVVSSRAVAVGGVALGAAQNPADGAVLAWVGHDGNHSQVHVARIEGRGRRVDDVRLTHGRTTASDVAVAWAGDGWLVAWVDTRDGNGEVYATKLDRSLRRTGRDERITRAVGDASDVVLLVTGKTAWLAWSDPRESAETGLGDVYVTTLRLEDARPASKEVRVLETAANSRSPRLAPLAGGALVVWVEDAPTGVDAPGAVLAARLASTGVVLGAPTRLSLASSGTPSALALESVLGGHVHLAVARSPQGGDGPMAIDALTLAPSGVEVGQASSVVDLAAPGSFEASLALAAGGVFYVDVGGKELSVGTAARRLRHADVVWAQ